MSQNKTTIRVVLADDHRILREGVRALLEGSALHDGRRIEVVGEAGVEAEAEQLCVKLKPDVAVLDVALAGGGSGLELCRRLRRASPEGTAGGAVVILSMYGTPDHVRRAREAGACAYVIKGSGVSELAEAIGRAADGGTGPFPALAEPAGGLTERERQVLVEIVRGRSNKEVASNLGISVHTVNTHRVHLMDKLDVHDLASLTRKALELGLE